MRDLQWENRFLAVVSACSLRVIHNRPILAILTPHDKHGMRIAALYPRAKPRGFTARLIKGETPFSRIPLYSEDIQSITGFILKNEILLSGARGQLDLPLQHFRREIMTITRSISLSKLLDLFLNTRQHIALVVGEYGETQGIVTLEDVLETLLGMEIMDEVDKVEDMQVLARQQWEKRALALGIDLDLLYSKEEPDAEK